MKVFISYKWDEPDHNLWVERLASDLRAKGVEALLDRWEVRLGESFSDYMVRGIDTADAVLFIMTPRSVSAAEAAGSGGGAVKFEIQLATARRLTGDTFRFIGILRRGDRPTAHLRDFRYADFRDDTSYETTLRHLVADLQGRIDKPPVLSAIQQDISLVECASVGEELGMTSMQGEFLLGTRDIIVWEQSSHGPSSPIGLFRRQGPSYFHAFVGSIPFATRIHSAPDGWIVATQEHRGVHVIDLAGARRSKFLSIDAIGEPVIRAEVQHHALPILAIGTDYGKIVLWDWHRDELIFERRYFPRDDIVWISGLAFDGTGNVLVFCVNNTLFCLRARDGEVTSEQPLGPPEETVKIAMNSKSGAVAVGGVMDTKVYSGVREPSLMYEIRNSVPMVTDLRFSQDGALLGITDGGFGGSGVAVVESTWGHGVQRFPEIWRAGKKEEKVHMFSRARSISFSESGGLVAIGEGGRIGIYMRNS